MSDMLVKALAGELPLKTTTFISNNPVLRDGIVINQKYKSKESPIVKILNLKVVEHEINYWIDGMISVLRKDYMEKEENKEGLRHEVRDLLRKLNMNISVNFYKTTFNAIEECLGIIPYAPGDEFDKLKQFRNWFLVHYHQRDKLPKGLVTFEINKEKYSDVYKPMMLVLREDIIERVAKEYTQFIDREVFLRAYLRCLMVFKLVPVVYDEDSKLARPMDIDFPLYVKFDPDVMLDPHRV